MLTQETVIPYLLRRDHLTCAELVASGVKVYDSSRRNGNFRVERQPVDALLLKQAREPSASRTVGREAVVYRASKLCLLRIHYAAAQSLFSNMTMTKACWSFAPSRVRARWRRIRIRAGFPLGRRPG